MGRARRRIQKRHTPKKPKDPIPLPCGCDARVLAKQMGMPLDELLRAAANAEHPESADGDLILLTIPRDDVPPDDTHHWN